MTTSMAVRRRAVRGALSAMFALIATCWITTPADAAKRDNKALDDETLGYIESNTLAIFYNELGHALIDVLNIPIYGQEEDAAASVGVNVTRTKLTVTISFVKPLINLAASGEIIDMIPD